MKQLELHCQQLDGGEGDLRWSTFTVQTLDGKAEVVDVCGVQVQYHNQCCCCFY